MLAPWFCSPRCYVNLGAVSASSMHQDARIFDQARVGPQVFTDVNYGATMVYGYLHFLPLSF